MNFALQPYYMYLESCALQGGQDTYDALSVQVIFCKRAL